MASLTEAQKLRDITRSKAPMDELCKQRLITPEACDWVKSALDPFHDLQLDHLRGYPDVSTEPTVVVKVRQALTVSRPPGLGDNYNWDCHIVTSPIDFQPCESPAVRVGRAVPFGNGARPTNDVAGLIQGSDATITHRMDGLLINSVPSVGTEGANMTYTPEHCPTSAQQGYQLQHINLDDYLDFHETDLGVYRILYSGFEVVNTTAQIYKQGAVTVYEYGNSYEVGASMPEQINEGGGAHSELGRPLSQPTTWFRCPPNTLA